MRTALLTTYLAPYRIPLYTRLADRHGIEVLCFGGGDRYVPPWFADLDAQLRDAPFPARRLRSVREALRLGRSYDALIAGFAGGAILPAAYASARRHRRPFVLWASVWAQPRSLAHALAMPATRHIYRHADAVIAYGEHVRRFVAGIRGRDEDVIVAPQSVEAEVFGRSVSEEEIARFRREHSLGDGPLIAYVGRLVPEKGVGVLLEAMRQRPRTGAARSPAGVAARSPAIVARGSAAASSGAPVSAGSGAAMTAGSRVPMAAGAGVPVAAGSGAPVAAGSGAAMAPGPNSPPMTLVLVGDGPMVEQARDAPDTRVIGALPRSALPVVYASAELTVVPSIPTPRFREPWGLVCNESMHQRRPVVATSAVGAVAGGLVRDGENGIVVAPGDARALRGAIDTLISDAGLRERLGAAALDGVRSYSYDAMLAGFDRALAIAHRQA